MKTTRVRLSEIEKDLGSFQFRSVAFDEERVQWLVANWKPEALDPLDVWLSPDGRKILIAGHHRLEAMIRRGDTSTPCRVHQISLQEAQMMALMSNANRLQYASFEYARCVDFLINKCGNNYQQAAKSLAISEGMARKYHSLVRLLGTDWEIQTDKLDLLSRAFEVASFTETYPLNQTEIQSLFKITAEYDLTANQIRQLLRDIRRQKNEQDQSQSQDSLFDLASFGDRTAKALKKRTFLDNCAAQTWWLYEMITAERHHVFPAEIKEPLMQDLRRIYAHCVGSEEEEVVPVRATKKGRKIPVNYDSQKPE
ncbi:ParB/RepB/Spo0J family partition protein [Nostoc sp. DedQUE07]|uniref:ParB/RepB/Spo0J family partition protein n=1 Tax=Nostoc sp. DedQUE07 TaxID=3075392 RepID=UPI002AD4CA18|nr:ParB N-terminal domain-containing protein [Nostoc sp. DedQUE07]MDZ8131891.1 ParB N-terminal domain-containing protein [Nostoc sp. DedQUE07]